ncbi:MAG: flavin reductase family protein [Chloroflexi bacterium]|nr:flavin reductase family protein [Chloroflexota bacterium]
MKVEIPLSNAHRLINPGTVALVTAAHEGKANVMTAAWLVPLSQRPALVGAAIHPTRFTHDLIAHSGEFTLNIPGRPLAEKVQLCGTISGADTNKFAAAGLTAVEARVVHAPWIAECLAHLECHVVDRVTTGDHSFFVGQIVAAWADEKAFDTYWVLKEEALKPLHHLGGRVYAILEKQLKV